MRDGHLKALLSTRWYKECFYILCWIKKQDRRKDCDADWVNWGCDAEIRIDLSRLSGLKWCCDAMNASVCVCIAAKFWSEFFGAVWSDVGLKKWSKIWIRKIYYSECIVCWVLWVWIVLCLGLSVCVCVECYCCRKLILLPSPLLAINSMQILWEWLEDCWCVVEFSLGG